MIETKIANFVIPIKLWNELELFANKSGNSVSSVIRTAIAEKIEQNGRE